MDTSKADALLGIEDAEVEDLTPAPTQAVAVIEAQEVSTVVKTDLSKLDDTFDTAKDTIKDAIETMKDVIEDASTVARNTGTADHYSSVSSLVGTLVSAAKALVDIEGKHHKIHKDELAGNEEPAPSAAPHVTNNLNFHGTTAELAAFLKKIRNGEQKLLQE